MFLLLVSRPEAKRELHGLTLTQEASEKDQEGVTKIARRWTSPRRSGGDTSAAKVCRNWRWALQEKLRSKLRRSSYGFLFISVVRVVSIPTLYNMIEQEKTMGRPVFMYQFTV